LTVLSRLGDGYRLRRTQGGWTALLDVPRLTDDDGLARRLLAAGLTAHPGWFYDVPDEGCLAISLLPETAAFSSSLQRLVEVVGNQPAR
jgi:DNA-binding transcriptional MocR family regulator